MNIEQLLRDAQPLDVIFYHGRGIFSTVIRLMETLVTDDSRFSHVGVVVTRELLPNVSELEDGVKYILESNIVIPYLTDGQPDIRSGKAKIGVQIRSLEDVARGFTTSREGNYIALSKLGGSPWNDEPSRDLLIDKSSSFFDEFGNKRYEANIFSLLSGICKCFGRVNGVVEDRIVDGLKILEVIGVTEEVNLKTLSDSTVFCSELIVRLFQHLSIIPPSVDAQTVTPMGLLNPEGKFKKFLHEPIRISLS